MDTNDDAARKEYAEAGVDLPELTEEKKEEPAKEVPEETPAETEEEAKAESEEEAPSQEPKEPRKRSIYDDLKETRTEKKEALARAEQAERERDEFKAKLEALGDAPSEKKDDAEDEVTAYAKQIGADPEAVKTLVELARKGMKPELPTDISAGLADFQKWKADNAQAIEAAAFDREFKESLPAIKELIPNASGDELEAVRAELDKLSHTTEYHDKPLDFVAFKNRAKLAALVSPKKPGLEKKGRVEGTVVEFEFDPNADYSKLSPEEQAKWEEAYKKSTSSPGLLTDAQGRKTIL